MTPTQRTLSHLRELGWTCQKTEHWNAFARRRVDLFGCIDILALRPPEPPLGIQATSAANHAARIAKAKALPALRAWLESGCGFEVWSFRKAGRGKRKTWTLRREAVTLEDVT